MPICAPWNLNFEKCRNLFLHICMKNVLVQFRRRYLICGRENLKNINVIDTPFLPFKIKIFSKRFLSTPLRTHTDISSKFHVSNFNSQDIFLYIYNPVLPISAPWNLNFEKCRNLFLRICMKNVKTISYFAVEKMSKT